MWENYAVSAIAYRTVQSQNMLLLLLVQNVNLEWMIVVEGDFAASEFLGDFDVGDAVVV